MTRDGGQSTQAWGWRVQSEKDACQGADTWLARLLGTVKSVAWRKRGLLGAGALGFALVAGSATALPAAAGASQYGSSGNSSKFIVFDPSAGSYTTALSAVSSVGGSISKTLSSADGVSASLNPTQVSQLSTDPGVEVYPDVAVSVQSTTTTSSTTQCTSSSSGLLSSVLSALLPGTSTCTSSSSSSGSSTSGSSSSGSTTSTSTSGSTRAPAAVFPQQTRATKLWSNGDTGQGVNVAVLDTGIDPLPDFAGRLVGGVDLSGEGNPLQDGYGHGTFVAGLIAGNGVSSNGAYEGEAPGAGLVSVKLAGASGQTDLATVIAGVDWTIANSSALNIGVMNMSLGFQPVSSTVVNPLDIAVQNAWQSGIVVVTAAGNAGPFNGTILSPGDDPMVITAGAVDDLGQTNPANDTMTAFSSVGPTDPDGWFKPDLVASGRSVVSLAAPGSTVYNDNPSARVGGANFVGSGTSFSSAITAGAAALVLEADPSASPDNVKARLLDSTFQGPAGNPFVDGHGTLDALGAVTDFSANNVGLIQSQPTSVTPMGGTVSLETTWAGSAWNASNWTGSAWNGSAWNGSAWNGSAWNGSAWNGSAWNGSAWNGSAWNG
ncbi:MAG TPA: S8 family peptidase, partial [Acidimicrobiales bacterium]|nr:S8 family peptidase [Acidimicrobiales bacterium]